MKTTTQPPTSPTSQDLPRDRAHEQEPERATTWAFYFLMVVLGLSLLLMLGMVLFSL